MNILNALKRLITNKNTVTIFGVIVIIFVLYLGYNYQVQQATTPQSYPVAKVTIQPRTQITAEMIMNADVIPSMLKGDAISNKASIIGKYVNYNTVIPEGSLFYKATVVTKDELPDTAFVSVKEGEVPYAFPVTTASTYGNSIMPGNYIDIYMKAKDDNGKLIVGKLVENIEVLAVKDATGKNVFENTDENRTPALMIFGLEEEINILLRKASYMTEFSVILFPVPHGQSASTGGTETQVSTLYLKDFINSHTIVIDEASGTEEETTEEDSSEVVE